MDRLERARRYVATMDAAVSGAGGHTATFKVAIALVKGFDLTPDQARPVMEEYNRRCTPPWSPREIEHKLRQAERASPEKPNGYLLGSNPSPIAPSDRDVKAAPRRDTRRREFDRQALVQEVGGFALAEAASWLAERSPVWPENVEPSQFIEALYRPGEAILVFTNEYSQGDYGWRVGAAGKGRWWKLAQDPNGQSEPVETLPASWRKGVWFLNQPVSGKWALNGEGKLTRRSEPNVTDWRYLVIESDNVEPDRWVELLAGLPLAVAAVYTSGGRSVHSLIRVDAASKGAFDAFRDNLRPFLSKVGADPQAMSAVRLTRLPGCVRRETGGLQRLLYLNPDAPVEPLCALPRQWVICEPVNA